MFKKLCLICLFAWTSFSLSYSQDEFPICGVGHEDIKIITERLLENKADLAQNKNRVRFRETIYVPIVFHLVARNDGSGRISETAVLDRLCELNEDFEGTDIQFFLQELNYFDNTTVFSNHKGTEFTFMSFERKAGAINVYIIQNADTGTDLTGGRTEGYYIGNPALDWIVIRKSAMENSNIAFTHEMGHYFTLLHTFNGWDQEVYDPAVHGNPAPSNSPRGITTERVNRDNCNSEGDFLCDTPPDYGFGFGWNECEYTPQVLDPNGDLVDPDEVNFMSYFLRCPLDQYNFSESQTELMYNDLTQTPSRAALVDANPDNTSTIDGTMSLTAPVDGAATNSLTSADLSWEPLDGADQYLVQIARTPAFTGSTTFAVVTNTNSVTVEDLRESTNYFWRVRPFNSYFTCRGFSAIETFKTEIVSGVNSIEAIQSWSVYPNPLSNGRRLELNMQSNNNIIGQVRLLNYSGKEIQNYGNVSIGTGGNNLHFDLSNVGSGLYILQLSSPLGSLTEKVIVLD